MAAKPVQGVRGGVKSCLRALDVIEHFARVAVPARTIDISEALGIPNSSADEILRTLASTGHLSYNRTTKRYVPSYKLIVTMRGLERGFFGGQLIYELLDELRARTGGTVFLTLQNDCWIESVASVEGCWDKREDEVDFPTEVIRYDQDRWRPGTNFAAAMLAQQSNVEIMDLALRAQKLGLGPKGPASMKSLVDRIARTRAQGFALCRRSDHVQVDSIASPLQMPHSVSPYAVGIVGNSLFESDADVKRIAATMRSVILRYSGRIYQAPAHIPEAAGVH